MVAPYRYLRLADELEAQIQDGSYRPGDRLPSIRKLRSSTKLSVMTISRALEELEQRGVAVARPRSGYYVRSRPSHARLPAQARTTVTPRNATLHALTESIVAATGHSNLVPLGGAALSPALVPLKQLSRLTREQLSRDPAAMARYSESAGLAVLRGAIAKRSVGGRRPVSADDVVITHGCMHAIQLSLTCVASAGDVIAVESPTFFGVLQLLRDLGMRALEIPVDPQTGVDLDALDVALSTHDVRAVIVTPASQNPVGATMPAGHRSRLLAMSAEHQVPIIEDDVYGDLRWDEPRPRTLLSEDEHGLVLHCSSVSKTLAPGMRIGWVVPGRFGDRVRQHKLSSSICSPALSQLVVASFLRDGGYDRHLRKLRPKLREQVRAVRGALSDSFGDALRVTSPDGGFLLWAQLDRAVDSAALYVSALEAGVSILPGVVFSLGRGSRSYLRISCGHPFDERMRQGIETLARLATTVRR